MSPSNRLVPVVAFVYRRPQHTRRMLDSLAKASGASQTDLIIFSDGPKPEHEALVAEVRSICREAIGFASVRLIESPHNQGLAYSVITGVSTVLENHDAVIVVEDDLVFTPLFLDYMNQALSQYQHDPKVFSISAYTPPPDRMKPVESSAWFCWRPSSWGWATWRDRWALVDWSVQDRSQFLSDRQLQKGFSRGGRDLPYFLKLQLSGGIDSWAVRFAWTQFRLDRLTLYPRFSFVDNEGLDGTGTHSLRDTHHRIDLALAKVPSEFPLVQSPDPQVMASFRRHYEGSILDRFLGRIRKIPHKLRSVLSCKRAHS